MCFTYQFVRAKSYDGSNSTGQVNISGYDPVRNHQHVLLVEDIVDTGITLARVIPVIEKDAKSLEVCSLLIKRLGPERDSKIVPKYVGFSIPDKFVIGFGLDFNERYRDLRDIWVISEFGIKFRWENE